MWLVLISLKSGRLASQRELAEAVGIQEPRSGLSDAEASQLETLLTRLRDNVSAAFD